MKLPETLTYKPCNSDEFGAIEMPDGRLLSLDCDNSPDDARFMQTVADRYNAHQWRPIGTVPQAVKDTRAWILVAFRHDTYGVVPHVAYWAACSWAEGGGYWTSPGGSRAITHWMPLPDDSNVT